MNTKVKRPLILTTPVNDKAFEVGYELPREQPSLLFPAWTIPPTPCSNLESCEIGKPYCWEYDFSWKNTFRAHGDIQNKLKDQAIAGITPSPGVSQFWDAIRRARNRVYFFDRHFEPSDLCRVLLVLRSRPTIVDERTVRFLLIANLEEHAGAYRKQFLLLLNSEAHNLKKLTISIHSTNGDDQIHDRFALIDNTVWHFGAKIGAMHKSVNAFSGPWKDEEERMEKFFRNLVYMYKNNDFIGVPCDFGEDNPVAGVSQ